MTGVQTCALPISADVAGNTSDWQSVSFTVAEDEPEDTTAPTVTAEVEGDDTEEVTLTLTADDGDGSGVAEVHYRMAGEEDFEQYDGAVSFTEPGDYTVEFRAADVAGNASDWQSVSFTVIDGSAACPDPDDGDTIVIGGIDTGVENVSTGNGCTANDLIDDEASWSHAGGFLRHVSTVGRDLYRDGLIGARDRAELIRAAARSGIGRTPRGRL